MFVNHCGINFRHRNFRIRRPEGSKDYLFLYTKTPAIFTLDGKEIPVPKNTVFLYKKNSPQFFRGAEEIYINDYIHFNTESEADEAFLAGLDPIYNTPISLPDVSDFMSVQQKIVYETKNRSTYSREAIDALLRYFLIKLTEATSRIRYESRTLDKINHLRNEIYDEPDLPWSVKMMAQRVNFSPSYFQKIYREIFNIPCMTDVISSRIERAKSLLMLTDLTARQIAVACGYENETHFSRQFRQITGKTPGEYRKT
ncbi:MAG: helix-turn-helix transcriptional regulator [Clostridia bacterium]|nr:helix-turn-helix transcriptional regulator [Clostridia bacterium]